MGDNGKRRPDPNSSLPEPESSSAELSAATNSVMPRADGFVEGGAYLQHPMMNSRQQPGFVPWSPSLPNRGPIPPNSQNLTPFTHSLQPNTAPTSAPWPNQTPFPAAAVASAAAATVAMATATPPSSGPAHPGRPFLSNLPMQPDHIPGPGIEPMYHQTPIAMYPSIPHTLNVPHPVFPPYAPVVALAHQQQPILQPHSHSLFPPQTLPLVHQQNSRYRHLPRSNNQPGTNLHPPFQYPFQTPGQPNLFPNSPTPPTRGPPRKPRQSGHALWVGNLPPHTSIVHLKDHFSREATDDIESVKLISKSHCAFVNYKTQAACNEAVQRFNETRFFNVRLLCRLRRTSNSNTPPTDPSQSSPHAVPSGSKTPVRYFILKSLTVHDLEESIRDNIWATQSHNEAALNAAYHSTEDVYLIFSANKSGEYFGYARMQSAIPAPDLNETELSRRVVSESSSQQPYSSPDESSETHQTDLPDSTPPASSTYPIHYVGPRSIPTEATEWAPRGRITEDIARELIFWEADEDDQARRRVAMHRHEEATVQRAIGASEQRREDKSAPGIAQPSPSDSTTPSQQPERPIIARSSADLSTSVTPINTGESLSLPPPESPSTQPDARESQDAPETPLSSQGASTGSGNSSSSNNNNRQRRQEPQYSQPLGNPFRISWQSQQRVPFWRTKGLKNSLNNNREVKIARDGTEVEAGVGKVLLQMFAVPGGPSSSVAGPIDAV